MAFFDVLPQALRDRLNTGAIKPDTEQVADLYQQRLRLGWPEEKAVRWLLKCIDSFERQRAIGPRSPEKPSRRPRSRSPAAHKFAPAVPTH